ncbi:MAG TPA: GIY-YIG nuclease family protein [Halothiobacillus sp.]|nr:GIY-YIG nuclease family protein [Halothiobacillus sp.]
MNNLFGLEFEEIIKKSKRAPKRICGIYFLIDQGGIVYVGQSCDAELRVRAHALKADRNKIYDKYFLLPCKRNELDVLERYYINKFLPKYNIDHLTEQQRISSARRPGSFLGIVTPLGYFRSLRAAASAHSVSYQAIADKIRRHVPGWSKFSEVDEHVPPRVFKKRGPKPRVTKH